jgi:ligand-binding sensor domain-containing protein
MTAQQVRAIAFAPDGTMWVGYADAGIDLFASRTLTAQLRHLSTADGLRGDNVWAIAMNGNDAWVSTDGGVAHFTLGAGGPSFVESFATAVISQNGAVDPLAIDGDGGLWLGTASGLVHRRPDGSLETFTETNSPLVSNDVHAVAVDRTTGAIWIGTGQGANRLHPASLAGGGAASDKLLLGPNPAQAGAGMRLAVTTSDGTALVRTPVEIYDLGGRLRARLVTDGRGVLTWNGAAENGRRLPAGVYFLRALALTDAGQWETRARGRLVLLP